jgi:hypothetical protein
MDLSLTVLEHQIARDETFTSNEHFWHLLYVSETTDGSNSDVIEVWPALWPVYNIVVPKLE